MQLNYLSICICLRNCMIRFFFEPLIKAFSILFFLSLCNLLLLFCSLVTIYWTKGKSSTQQIMLSKHEYSIVLYTEVNISYLFDAAEFVMAIWYIFRNFLWNFFLFFSLAFSSTFFWTWETNMDACFQT